MKNKTPIITDIQKYSIHDGKGIRTTVFFKGCPLHCIWCHNPETQRFQKEILYYRERCSGCGECSMICPQKCITMQEGWALWDANTCSVCGLCSEECCRNAREICGKSYELEVLIDQLVKDMAFYETSGGGVTLSGGEVLAQDISYVTALAQRLCNMGISVNIDTCGAVPYTAIESVLPYTDTFLYDVKMMDTDLHRQYIGVHNQKILDNLVTLSDAGANIWIRIPLIGGVNDTVDNFSQLGDFLIQQQIRYERVCLLPYHNTGSGKYGRIQRNYEGEQFTTPTKERMEELKALLTEKGIRNVVIEA